MFKELKNNNKKKNGGECVLKSQLKSNQMQNSIRKRKKNNIKEFIHQIIAFCSLCDVTHE